VVALLDFITASLNTLNTGRLVVIFNFRHAPVLVRGKLGRISGISGSQLWLLREPHMRLAMF